MADHYERETGGRRMEQREGREGEIRERCTEKTESELITEMQGNIHIQMK